MSISVRTKVGDVKPGSRLNHSGTVIAMIRVRDEDDWVQFVYGPTIQHPDVLAMNWGGFPIPPVVTESVYMDPDSWVFVIPPSEDEIAAANWNRPCGYCGNHRSVCGC